MVATAPRQAHEFAQAVAADARRMTRCQGLANTIGCPSSALLASYRTAQAAIGDFEAVLAREAMSAPLANGRGER